MQIASIVKAIKKYYKVELFLLLPIFYSLKVAIDDRDFAQMVVTFVLLFISWIFSICRSAQHIARLSDSQLNRIQSDQ